MGFRLREVALRRLAVVVVAIADQVKVILSALLYDTLLQVFGEVRRESADLAEFFRLFSGGSVLLDEIVLGAGALL